MPNTIHEVRVLIEEMKNNSGEMPKVVYTTSSVYDKLVDDAERILGYELKGSQRKDLEICGVPVLINNCVPLGQVIIMNGFLPDDFLNPNQYFRLVIY